jgi:hypothetical protein
MVHAVCLSLARDVSLVLLLELQWVVYFVGFALCAEEACRTTHGVAGLTRLFLWIAIAQCAAGLFTAFTGQLPWFDRGTTFGQRLGDNLYRATGTVGTPNSLAGLLATAVLIAAYAPRSWVPFARVSLLRWVLVAFFAAGVVSTQSKSGFGMLFAAALLVSTARAVRTPSASRFIVAAAWGAALTGGILLSDALTSTYSNDLAERVTFTATVLRGYLDSDPLVWLFGSGFRQTAFVNDDTSGWVTAHNTYVAFLAETGIAGLLLFAGLVGLTLRWSLASGAWWIVGAECGLLAHFYTETFLYGYHYQLILVMLFMMSYRLFRASRRRTEGNQVLTNHLPRPQRARPQFSGDYAAW